MAFAGKKTDSAAGTGKLTTAPAFGAGSAIGRSLSFGVGAVVVLLSQAPNHSADVQSAIKLYRVCMQFPKGR